LIDKLNFLKRGTDAAAASAEDERLMQLFQNRAGLKKAYDDLQEELHLLGDRLKQQEGATLRLQEQLDSGLITPEEAKLSQNKNLVTRALGIDPLRTFPNASGRPMYLLDERDPILELI